MALFLNNGGKIFFRNGLPSMIFWEPEILEKGISLEELEALANEELRVCGFRVRVSNIVFEEHKHVLSARVIWRR
jgi:hypothetical protein